MPKMYVANCTQQIQIFMYRLPELNRPFTQEIPIGGQVQVAGLAGGELSTLDVEAIVRQYSKYGLVEVSEIDRRKPFVGVCYSLDRPVTVSAIQKALEHNIGILDAQGREIRQLAAVGVNQRIEQEMPGLRGLEVQAIELDNPKTGKTGEFADAIRVDPEAPRGAPPRSQKGGRSRRAA